MTLGTRLWRGFVVLLALTAIGGQGALAWGATWVTDNRQWISDRAFALQFEPDPELLNYVRDAALTEEGEIYLFASLPEIVPAGEFDRYCSRDEPGIGVLGCYRLAEKRIYLYDVTDERLEAMEPVIAAHEMLHAAWHRFTIAEQQRLAGLLEEGFAALPDDHPLHERIASYEANDPNSRIPELYALMGTEIAELPEELEQHYRTFFTDRSSVVALADEVYAIFATFDSELQSLADDLKARSDIIDGLKAQYELDSSVLGADISVYNERVARYNAGEDVSGSNRFDAERDDLIARQQALKAERDEILRQIDEYNALLDQLNILNQELGELNQGINITLEEQESIGDTEEVASQ
ncbi:MAG: hypothetical protein ACO2Z1_05965 [Pontimonas sp.]